MKEQKWNLINDELADIRKTLQKMEESAGRTDQTRSLVLENDALREKMKDLRETIRFEEGKRAHLTKIYAKEVVDLKWQLKDEQRKVRDISNTAERYLKDFYKMRDIAEAEANKKNRESFGTYALAVAGTVFVILGFWKLVELFVLLFI